MHCTDAAVFPRLLLTTRTAGKGISIGTDVMSWVSFHLFYVDVLYVQNLHAVIYLIFCFFFSMFVQVNGGHIILD